MPQIVVSAAKAAVMARIEANGTVGTAVNLKNVPNNNIEESIFEVGDKIIFPSLEELLASAFDRVFDFNGRKAHGYGIVVDLTSGEAKALYFSQLRKSVTEYTEEGGKFVKGEIHTFDNALSRMVKGCKTAYEICEKLAGRTIEVTELEFVPTAQFLRNGATHLRLAQLAHWDFSADDAGEGAEV